MRRMLGLLVFACFAVYAQESTQSPVPLIWKNIASQYKSLQEIRPSVLNVGKRPIFLSRLWPDTYAQVQRLSEETNEWEFGEWGIRCGTVAQSSTPIEIPAQGERNIGVYWQLSTDDWDNPKYFIVLKSLEKRSLTGKYRLVFRYAREPWTLGHHPATIYSIASPEFIVTNETK